MRLLSKLLFFSLSYPKFNILIFFILSTVSILLFLNNITIVTSTEELISQKLDFRIEQKKLKDKFPNLSNNNVISIKSNSSENLELITNNILNDFEKKNEIFNFFYCPQTNESFKKNILRIVDDTTREKIIFKLYNSQPFLSVLASNPKIKGFNDILDLSISNNQLENNTDQFINIFSSFRNSIRTNEKVIWSQTFFSNNENLIVFSLKEEYLKKNEFSNFYDFLLSIEKKYSNRAKINFTGGQILDYEELENVTDGAIAASIMSLFFVSLVLILAFRNFKIIFALILSIIIGLAITLGITSITLGKLNMISVAFAVLFIGISVDFGIQITMKFLHSNLKKENALYKLQNFTSSIFIVSISSIIGFLSFIPTEYIGLSELGIISAIGVFVGVFTNLFFLSSLLKVSKIHEISYKNIFINSWLECLTLQIYRNPKKTLCFFFIVFIFVIINLDQLNFNSDPLKLKNQNSSSVKLAYDLMSKDPSSDYKISIVKKEIDNALLIQLLESPNIKSVFRLNNISYSEDLTDDLEHLSFLFSLPNNNSLSNSKDLDNFKKNLEKINELNIPKLSLISNKLLNELNSKDLLKQDVAHIENLFFSDFINLKNYISNIVNFENSIVDELPLFYREKYLSIDGFERIEIFPEEFIIHENKTNLFVNEVKKIFPNATGMPVVQNGAKKIVVESFVFAFTLSLLLLFVFTFLIFKNYIYVILCFAPLFSSLLFTLLIMQIFNINFNFANMISLPLLFSLGISYSIFILRNFYESKSFSSLMQSSIIPGVFFSALTTICSFSTFATSSHEGTSSMGILLFLSMGTVMINSLVVLPLLIKLTKSKL